MINYELYIASGNLTTLEVLDRIKDSKNSFNLYLIFEYLDKNSNFFSLYQLQIFFNIIRSKQIKLKKLDDKR